MKSGIRILALDDSRFKSGDKNVLVVGVVGRSDIIEGVLSCGVEADGNDATEKILRMASGSRFLEQIRLIAINGTTVAGLNVIDISCIHSRLGIPVIAITRKKPHPAKLERSIMSTKTKGYRTKIAMIEKLKKNAKIDKMGGFYVQSIGIEKDSLAKHISDSVALLRLAHIIASGVSRGESSGRM